MSDERIRPQRQLLESLQLRAIQEAQFSSKAKDAVARYGKTDVADAIRDILRLTEEGVLNKSDIDGERKYLTEELISCGVTEQTVALLTHAFFERFRKPLGLLGHLKDFFENKGES